MSDGLKKITNTRDGENPNVLGAQFDKNNGLSPVLAVNGIVNNDKKFYTTWEMPSIDQKSPDASPIYIQMKITNSENKIDVYRLGVPNTSVIGGTACVFYKVDPGVPNKKVFDKWYLPKTWRIFLAYDMSIPLREQLSLDAGIYPELMIWKNVESVNQTWLIENS